MYAANGVPCLVIAIVIVHEVLYCLIQPLRSRLVNTPRYRLFTIDHSFRSRQKMIFVPLGTPTSFPLEPADIAEEVSESHECSELKSLPEFEATNAPCKGQSFPFG